MSLFQHINGLKPKKNKFNISAGNAGTMELGELIPVYVNELMPGDRVRLNASSIVRLMPLKNPMLQKLIIKFEAFFVPIRILDDKFKDYYTGGKDGKNDYVLPLINDIWDFDAKRFIGERGPINFGKYSLGDYFGLPVDVEFGGTGDPDNTSTPLAYPFWAYTKIWQDYYIDENVSDYAGQDDMDVWQSLKNEVLYRSYKKDYFTSALPFQQRGEAGAFEWKLEDVFTNAKAQWDSNIPIRSFSARSFSEKSGTGQSASVGQLGGYVYGAEGYSPFREIFTPGSNIQPDTWSTSPVPIDTFISGVPAQEFPVRAYGVDERSTPDGDQYKYTRLDDVVYPGLNNNKIVGINEAEFGFNVADLRYQVQLQKYLERNARAGWRYNEYILAHFGQYTSDRTIDRAQFIGSAKSEISISEIPQTSATDETSPQGTLAGRGIGTIAVNLGTYKAEEPGYLFVLQSIVPAVTYASQGVNKMWTRRTRFDFYTPEFAHLSEQPVYKRELMATGDVVSDSDEFGYQGIYDEYRFKSSIAVSDFRDTLSQWKMSREFSNVPELNSEFLSIDGKATYNLAPFAYQGDDFKHYIYDTYIDVLAFRPMPLTAEPGFVDHF